MKNLWRNYNLSIVLAGLFIISWFGQAYFQWQEFSSDQMTHGQTVEMSDFVPEFLSATFENWQSEFLQLLSMVVLTSFLVHRGSPESKDGDDEMKASLAKIEKQLQQLSSK